jgi:ion channel-forming bestrophin family protein
VIDYEPHHWRDHFFALRGSMARAIGLRALVCAAAAAFVTVVHHEWHHFESTDKVHALIGTPLGLLLVFRTNASYDRFWEARKIWGSIVNESRNLARSASVLLADDPGLVARVVRLGIAFPYACMNALRGKHGLGPVAAELPAADADALTHAQHAPLAVAVAMSRAVIDGQRRGLITDVQQSVIEHNVQVLIDCIGACERIRRTPLPFAYVVHLRRALAVYCGTLPMALVHAFGWLTVPVTFLVAYVLLGIEEIGVEIEEPFGTDDNDLPLDRFCSTIEQNLRALLPPNASKVTP